jgi:hypothetical protein
MAANSDFNSQSEWLVLLLVELMYHPRSDMAARLDLKG